MAAEQVVTKYIIAHPGTFVTYSSVEDAKADAEKFCGNEGKTYVVHALTEVCKVVRTPYGVAVDPAPSDAPSDAP
jgi:hypothetical protein